MTKVMIYTDGACSGNPGIGGWAAILICGKERKTLSGSEEHTTNNRMELTGPIQALSALKRSCEVELYSDSTYLINAFNQGWIYGWIKRGWLKKDNRPVENPELWKELLEAAAPHHITWIKVRGHSGEDLNEECDRIAKQEIRKLREERND